MNVLIVESRAKGQTLQKYLGQSWRVVPTGGHVQTLPHVRDRHGKDASKAYWANRPGELPDPPWVWTDHGEAALQKILAAADNTPVFWIATDPDREGELIAWRLETLLREHGVCHRISFQEVTQEALESALQQPRHVAAGMVESALVRMFLDRLVGYRTSRLAARALGKGASMGRVQTPTLGFVVDRELERERFIPTPYFEVRAFSEGVELQVRFHDRADAACWRDRAGRVEPTRTFDQAMARRALEAIDTAAQVRVSGLQAKPSSRRPQPPFTTDALLQDAGSRFGWSPRKTTALASQLYETGHITYLRTDSTRLAASAVEQARAVIVAQFGETALGSESRTNVATGPTQDAHEAIRPTHLEIPDVDVDDADARKLYRLIRARTLASQMRPSEGTSLSIEAICEELECPLIGRVSWRTVFGWEVAYREFEPSRPTAPPDIPLALGAIWRIDASTGDKPNPVLIADETKPPARLRAHALIKAMKDAGIGRPSTYSSTLDRLLERGYLVTEDGALAPTPRGRSVWLDIAPLYAPADIPETDVSAQDEELFSTAFTAAMEDGLDEVARGVLSGAARWEAWRDQIRTLHDAAGVRVKSGPTTPRQQELLKRLLHNVPLDSAVIETRPDPSTLSYTDAKDLIDRLIGAGIEPAPSDAQLQEIMRLLESLNLPDDEQRAIIGETGLDAIGTSAQASRLIDELRHLHEQRMPPSAKQRRYIDDLLKKTSMPEAEAAERIGLTSLNDLTGGPEGTASQLIEILERQRAQDQP